MRLYFRENIFPIELLSSGVFTWPSPLHLGSVDIAPQIFSVDTRQHSYSNVDSVNSAQSSGATPSKTPIRTLNPTAIFLSKSSRASSSLHSDRPATVAKHNSDVSDMVFLAGLMGDEELRRTLGLYSVGRKRKFGVDLGRLGERYEAIQKVLGRMKGLGVLQELVQSAEAEQ